MKDKGDLIFEKKEQKILKIGAQEVFQKQKMETYTFENSVGYID